MKEAARFFKALSDESRLKMLWLLFNRRELCVCDVMAVLKITQSKASRHLAALRHIGIATDRREGLWSYYSLRQPEDELAKNHLKLLRTTLAKNPDAQPLLDKLNAWLKEKSRGASCLNNNAPSRTKTNGTSISALLQRRRHEQ
ncbi:MAG TPA: metalloregulator ArsR/SmtB family transcription factor [Acidobacteriota bacterium]|nr:metalloregulator ArsR/SmtB family transcription factor [Acidobacteriota bacterium]